MPKREKVPAEKQASPGQVGNIIALIAPNIRFTSEQAQRITSDPPTTEHFVLGIRQLFDEFNRVSRKHSDEEYFHIAGWVQTYKKLFGKKPDFSSLCVPAKPEGHGPMLLIVVAKELWEWTDNRPVRGTIDALRRHFPCRQFSSDNELIGKKSRDSKNGSYAVWIRDVRESGDESRYTSDNEPGFKIHNGITFLERLLLEADYFFGCGEHLDHKGWALCTGSFDEGFSVPGVHWNTEGFFALWLVPFAAGQRPLFSRSVWF